MKQSSSILDNLESQFNVIKTLKSQVIKPVKVQLHPNIEGFTSPSSYGIYRNTGGVPLGVTGKDFEPQNLELFIDVIVDSILSCGLDLDINKLVYKEYKGGSKVSIEMPLGLKEIKSPMIGDVLDQKIQFNTGFDGLTKTSLSFYSLRLWCSNGAKSWKKDIEFNFKNTKGNAGKSLLMCNEIFQVINQTNDYVDDLNKLVTRPLPKNHRQALDTFLENLLGYTYTSIEDKQVKRRNILDKINQSIAIEMENTGANEFSLLQGITRYTTHELAKGKEEVLLFDNASKLNQKAHNLLLSHLN